MALSKYIKQAAPTTGLQLYVDGELRRVELTTSSIIDILKALNVPVQLGAPDSGGLGFRMLRVPN